MIADFRGYPEQPTYELVNQLAVVVSELYNAHIVLGSTQAQERSARVHGFLKSPESSVAARERDADSAALHLTVAVYETQSRIRALTEERDFIRLLLDASEG